MDPNQALSDLRDAVSDLDNVEANLDDAADRVYDLFVGLDTWLSKGGFLPSAWERGPVDPEYLVAAYDGPVVNCADCGFLIHQRPEKALSGETQMVWADVDSDAWVCDVTGNEHRIRA